MKHSPLPTISISMICLPGITRSASVSCLKCPGVTLSTRCEGMYILLGSENKFSIKIITHSSVGILFPYDLLARHRVSMESEFTWYCLTCSSTSLQINELYNYYVGIFFPYIQLTARKYGDQLFQVICLTAEDINTRSSTLPSDRLRTSVIRQVTELCTRKFLPVLEVHGRQSCHL